MPYRSRSVRAHAVVEPEQVEAAVLGPILDDEHDIVESVDHVVGKLIELVDDELLEGRGIHVNHAQPCSLIRESRSSRHIFGVSNGA